LARILYMKEIRKKLPIGKRKSWKWEDRITYLPVNRIAFAAWNVKQ